MNSKVILTDSLIFETEVEDFVLSPECGGIVTFIGTVRNHSKGRSVVRLEFEAYERMAVSEMQKIADRALDKFDIQKVAIFHRVGVLEIGEVPVIISVSAHHRKAAFQACEFAIDTLKETVPIWKKEVLDDGEVWISATP